MNPGESLHTRCDVDRAADDRELHQLVAAVAIKITGRIPALNVRSVPPQDPPYPPLAEVVEEQTVFELRDVAVAKATPLHTLRSID